MQGNQRKDLFSRSTRVSVKLQTGLFIALFFCLALAGQAQQKSREHRFVVGESLTYSVYYYLMGVWVGAGDVTFTVEDETYNDKSCYKFQGVGKTHKRYDWFFKVRDTYTSFADKQDLRPYRFSRDVLEGSFYMVEENLYFYSKKQIYSITKVKESDVRIDTLPLKPNSFDVLSLIYHVRDIDFASYKEGDKIPIRMVIDRETFDLYIRFLGTKNYDHSEYGEIECYVFSPLLVEGTMFKEGEKMTVWVTKDSNVIPLYIESEIRVGSIRSELTGYSGLRGVLGENP